MAASFAVVLEAVFETVLVLVAVVAAVEDDVDSEAVVAFFRALATVLVPEAVFLVAPFSSPFLPNEERAMRTSSLASSLIWFLTLMFSPLSLSKREIESTPNSLANS